jgi:hypothetical protein
MAQFFHWHGREGRRHEGWHEDRRDRRRRHDEPGPDFPLPPFPPLPFLEVGEGEAEFAPADEEAEMHHRNRFRRQRYQSSDGMGESENGFAPESVETTRRTTGRWVRHRGRIIVLGA